MIIFLCFKVSDQQIVIAIGIFLGFAVICFYALLIVNMLTSNNVENAGVFHNVLCCCPEHWALYNETSRGDFVCILFSLRTSL
jgi:hypothetical protein